MQILSSLMRNCLLYICSVEYINTTSTSKIYIHPLKNISNILKQPLNYENEKYFYLFFYYRLYCTLGIM
ncbi:hypothetical protein BF9343_1467 [Bacteroides fragilis NCTC 9343]|uniref:Uncharacterized protein n=1 Tax=Bacteroides fragilis (strain ATCC 25285 / DSM 2151 / CCUG 4856 / JCM 11019 / LMG 10263 / NCTC 9343 / Onslow / VPI 2553 / EN-2) TaxID=272559 RepID=Q5LF50_BACFN|nr:hypothetical protein BF9343_1467 [Bacteroides fragilis NCTC 9343]